MGAIRSLDACSHEPKPDHFIIQCKMDKSYYTIVGIGRSRENCLGREEKIQGRPAEGRRGRSMPFPSNIAPYQTKTVCFKEKHLLADEMPDLGTYGGTLYPADIRDCTLSDSHGRATAPGNPAGRQPAPDEGVSLE